MGVLARTWPESVCTSCPQTSCWWCCSVCWRPLKSSALLWTESLMSSYSWQRNSNDQFQTQRNKPTNAGRVPNFSPIHFLHCLSLCCGHTASLFMRMLSLSVNWSPGWGEQEKPGDQPLEMFLQAHSGGFHALTVSLVIIYFQSVLQMTKSSHDL